jgi:hypothetical protein
MELKDMILSTLAELEDVDVAIEEEIEKKEKKAMEPLIKDEVKEEEKIEELLNDNEESSSSHHILEDERLFCESMRERILVLFEGFQSPTNKSIEAKVDLTLNFLEYLLAVVDERLENLDKK